MSMISELVKELRIRADVEGRGTINEHLMTKAADTIEMLSEKVREPKQEWIACSERLPSENGRAYLTYQCCEDTRWGWCQVLDYYDGWNCTKQDRESKIEGVVAWMPLPEPYKEGAGDD